MPNAPQTFRPPGMEPRPAGKPQRRFDNRESSWARGYDGDWYAVRNPWADKNPLCCACWAEDERPVQLDEVDHIIPFKSKNDPLRLDERNFQGLCSGHHRRKTQRDNVIRAEYDAASLTHGHSTALEMIVKKWGYGAVDG